MWSSVFSFIKIYSGNHGVCQNTMDTNVIVTINTTLVTSY